VIEKTSLDACIYAVNRIAGTPTNKTQDITDTKDKDNNIDIDSMIDELDNSNDTDNVINIGDIKEAK
jgi:hypothetical protein